MATLELLIDGLEPPLSVRQFSVREALSELFLDEHDVVHRWLIDRGRILSSIIKCSTERAT